MIDSERILGVVEPEGFTRAELSCPAGTELLVRRVEYGYRVSLQNVITLSRCWSGGRTCPYLRHSGGPPS